MEQAHLCRLFRLYACSQCRLPWFGPASRQKSYLDGNPTGRPLAKTWGRKGQFEADIMGSPCQQLAAVGESMSASLTELANKHQSDKGTTFGEAHGYTYTYEQLFSPLRNARIRLLEVGLRHDPYYVELNYASIPSLEMWLDYFPQAEILGFDIKDFLAIRRDRLTIFRGDQGNPKDLKRIAAELGPLDVVIDDGSHASFHQQLTFAHLFPCVRQNGMYIVEDLHFQPPRLESMLPSVPKTRDIFRSPIFESSLDVTFYCNDKLCVVRRRTDSHS
jgi:hypothetical protein